MEKALKYFIEAWNRIKSGDFFDENTNHIFDYMIKSLWKSEHQQQLKHDILKHLSKLIGQTKKLDNPPPFVYILISLKDNDINKELITEAIVDFVKSNASETEAYQLLNLIQTMDDKGSDIDLYVDAIINNLKPTMNKDMVEAIAHLITLREPRLMRKFLQKFLSFPDKSILKSFVQMGGRTALLQLLQLTTPGEVKKILNS